MQDSHHERSEEPSTEIPPATEQREETCETAVTLLNEPASTSSTRGSGWSSTELPNNTTIYEINDEDASSINKPNTSKRKRNPRILQTEDERKSGFKFVKDQLTSKASWDQITAEYNRAFEVDRSKAALKSMFDRWKDKRGEMKKLV